MAQSDTQYQFLYGVVAEALAKKYLMKQLSSQPSPKFRKLNDGMNAAALEEGVTLSPKSIQVESSGLINRRKKTR